MIEIDLRPDARNRSARRRNFSFSLPKLSTGGGGKTRDSWSIAAGTAAVLALVAVAWLFLGVVGSAEELEVRIEGAVRDSIRYDDVIQRSGVLQARRDSIAQRVAIIQQIDGARYQWSHLMDEMARALPDYTWLTRLIQVTPGTEVLFRVEGQSGTYFGLTTLMENMEASPFIQNVVLVTSEQVSVPVGGGANQLVYMFTLEASSQEPPPETVERVPLFGASVLPPNAGGI